MVETIRTDICVIGAGSGGLSVAAGAAQMGADVVLVEKGKMGGDCLNYGCVPSKSLIAAAHAADTVRRSSRFGVNGHEPVIDFNRVHVHDVIAKIAPHDSVERFEGLGVRVIRAGARFSAPDEVTADGKRIRARRYVIATGSSPDVPKIPGLDKVPYRTNESIFDLDECPEHLVVIGGGPIGSELAQAYRRLGAQVTLLQKSWLLPKDDPELVAVVARRFAEDGIDVREGVTIDLVTWQGNRIALSIDEVGHRQVIVGSHLLVSAGRRPNIAALDLDAAGVGYTHKGIVVNARLRTSNKRVFAIGDVAGGYQFTHMAAYHAGIVIRNALFRLPSSIKYHAVPWVTYTDPELAHVGLNETEAARNYGSKAKALKWTFAENDRAQAERETSGLIKLVVGDKGRILGASIVGRHAGELILPWVLAINEGLKISPIANLIVPYPTFGEVSKRAAGSYYTPTLFSARTQKLVRLIQRYA